MNAIYLDNAATTPLRREVREAMRPYLGETFGNASSVHKWGREARAALEDARDRFAAVIGARAVGNRARRESLPPGELAGLHVTEVSDAGSGCQTGRQ